MGAAKVTELGKRIGADAMCVHLNAGQELIQAHGDRDFRGLVTAIQRFVEHSPMPVIVKETGCGISAETARKLALAGVRTVDVSGAGGTSWVAVEAVRAGEGSDAAALGEELWDWGVPTAVSIVACATENLVTIASGGVRTGLDVARALALGARAGGMAAPMLRAQRAAGVDGVRAAIDRVTRSLRAVCLLTGSQRAADLTRAPRHLGAPLRSFLDDLSLT
jgi:isopentenyl-diphosphate delta-isomerase